MRTSTKLFLALAALTLLQISALPPAQAEPPLVSGFNGSIGGYGGWTRGAEEGTRGWINVNDGQFYPKLPGVCFPLLCPTLGRLNSGKSGFDFGGEARFALPIGNNFGAQADGMLGQTFGLTSGTARLHVFAGTSAEGTLGLLLQRQWLGGADATRAGGEGQIWLNAISLYGNGGYQWADPSSKIKIRDGYFACGEARWYIIPNAFVGVGGSWMSYQAAAFANGEVQFDGNLNPLSLFVRAGTGTDHYRMALAGMRFHFGAGPTLIARHRQDLPLPYAACGQEQFSFPGIGLTRFGGE